MFESLSDRLGGVFEDKAGGEKEGFVVFLLAGPPVAAAYGGVKSVPPQLIADGDRRGVVQHHDVRRGEEGDDGRRLDQQ